MNKAYHLIWNTLQQVWVVNSELGKALKKAKNTQTAGVVLATVVATILCSTAYADPAVGALPSLNNIASGSASIHRNSVLSQLTVTQKTDKLIANWNSFDVGVNAQVTFNQPSTSSIALNRIAATAPSQIFGRVNANGQLILVSPAGLTFGTASQVNASSVIASTLDITDANFLANTLQFDRGSATGTINNQGIIQANEGNTSVFASNINNSGTIRAKAGNVNLANGNRLTLNNTAGTATLNQVSGIAGVISSTGILRGDRLTTTDKGKIYLTGDRARNGSVVNLAGEITSTGNDIKGKTINVTGDTMVNASTNLNAINSINIHGALSVSGNNRLISLTHGTTGNDGLHFGENGKISMPGNTIRYRANNNYYTLIKTLAELQAIGSNSTTLAGQYVLAVDIDAGSTAITSFNPIGSSATTGFSGVLDGLGNSINNLTVNKPIKDEVGLIGFNLFGSLKNIVLNNATVTGQNHVGGLVGRNGLDNGTTGNSVISGNRISGSISGKQYVGGLLGNNGAYNASNITIANNSSTTTVTGRYNIGGLVGYAYIDNNSTFNLLGNTVDGNTLASAINDDKAWFGGLLGQLLNVNSSSNIRNNISSGNVTSSSRSSSIAAGIGHIYNSDASLNIESNTINGLVAALNSSSYAGGLVGYFYNFASTASSAPVVISNNSTTTTVSAGRHVGGLIGQIYGASQTSISGNTSSGNISGLNNVGGLIGDSNGNTINGNHATGYITASTMVGGLIGSNYDSAISNSYATGDIIPASGSGESVGGLVGNNNGASNISNSYATGSVQTIVHADSFSYVGGLVGANGYNNISNSYASGAVAGSAHIGGLVGYNIGNISNSHALGQVQSSASNAGGLVGSQENGTISNSYANGNVSSNTENDVYYFGGLVGHANQASINNSHATGNVNTGTTGSYTGGLVGSLSIYSNVSFDRNFSTGNVFGGELTGGLYGHIATNYDPVMYFSNSYSKGNVSGTYHTGGLIGYYLNSGTLYLTNTYTTATVTSTAPYSRGALVGTAMDSSGTSYLSNSFWNKSVSGLNNAIGSATLSSSVTNLRGLTTVETLQLANYTGWDISNMSAGSSIWYINEGIATPVLRSTMTP
jgi:filamentous hemagglutinin family protein